MRKSGPVYLVLAMLCVLVAPVMLSAATPPALVNYQGVLRDNNDKPLNGTFDMTFSFYDAQSAGNQILVDSHTSGNANPVTVTGGLFNVQLGGGTVSDGSGPGFYPSLDRVFRDFDTVYLEIHVGAETLTPRVRIQAEPYALNSSNLEGQPASHYLDTSSGGQIKDGALACSQGLLGYNDSGIGFGFGIWGRGLQGGGEFRDSNGSGVADVAFGDIGIDASGSTAGGHFAYSSGPTSEVFLGEANTAVDGRAFSSGGGSAGLMTDLTTGNTAYLGGAYAGVYGVGSRAGLFISNSNGSSSLGDGNWGLHAIGRFCGSACGGGGFFEDSSATGATAYVAYSNVGIETHASGSGGSFYNTNGIATAVATGSFGVSSNGTKSFVQNHPDDPKTVIAYTALEGDEAGTYTRGIARLVNGEARIPLGESFQWVTNPDVGLTAHLTPVGEWTDLYVVSTTTKELVVRSRDPRAADAAFNYVVFGLRIGFENNPVLQDKEHEMPIPASASGKNLFAKKPEFQRFTALARFSRMSNEVTGKDETPDLSASESLKSKIHVFDPARDGEAFAAPAPRAPAGALPLPPRFPEIPGTAQENAAISGAGTVGAPRHDGEAPETLSFPPNTSPVVVEGSVRAADVVTVTDAPQGEVVLASQPLDKGVVGIIGGLPDASWSGRAPLVLSGVVALCNVDATERAVAIGDLLVSSPTPGHAMRAGENPPPGTVIAKALEALEAGTGTIRVLVLSVR